MPGVMPMPSGPTLVTGAAAARRGGGGPATVRKWVQLGHLTAAGRQGRTHLFRLEDVFAAERATRLRGRHIPHN